MAIIAARGDPVNDSLQCAVVWGQRVGRQNLKYVRLSKRDGPSLHANLSSDITRACCSSMEADC